MFWLGPPAPKVLAAKDTPNQDFGATVKRESDVIGFVIDWPLSDLASAMTSSSTSFSSGLGCVVNTKSSRTYSVSTTARALPCCAYLFH